MFPAGLKFLPFFGCRKICACFPRCLVNTYVLMSISAPHVRLDVFTSPYILLPSSPSPHFPSLFLSPHSPSLFMAPAFKQQLPQVGAAAPHNTCSSNISGDDQVLLKSKVTVVGSGNWGSVAAKLIASW